LEECEKIADRIMVLSDGTISVLDTPTALRQLYKCGYLIETEGGKSEELRSILQVHGIENPEMEITEDYVKVVIAAEHSGVLAGILRDLTFKYLMSIQNLEEQIFSHVQEHEFQALRARESQDDADVEELHPRI
jgi:ABC-type multidrug transport system ATPase subunit